MLTRTIHRHPYRTGLAFTLVVLAVALALLLLSRALTGQDRTGSKTQDAGASKTVGSP
jgi:hypothetical protein